MWQAQDSFLEMAKASINSDITAGDVKEMMIQHILSADIFNTIFDEPHFHQENNIARELNKVIDTFLPALCFATMAVNIHSNQY